MAKSSNENRVPAQDSRSRPARIPREQREVPEAVRPGAKPARRRVNEITSAIGLTPITGRSGPRIAY